MIKNVFLLIAVGVSLLFILVGTGLLGFPLPIILLFLLFIFVIPALIYFGLKWISDPVPLYMPLLLALAVIGILIFGRGIEETMLVPLVLALVLSSLAVITPYTFLERKMAIETPWQIFSLISFIGVVLFFFSTLGESIQGVSQPPFFSSLPLTGWIFDGLIHLLQIQEIVYTFDSSVYSTLWACGYYLEVLFMSCLIYAVLCLLFPVKISPSKRD